MKILSRPKKLYKTIKGKKMYTNDLLEEKYKAQKQLSEKAEFTKTDYYEIVKKEVKDLYARKGWKMRFEKRSGGYLKKSVTNDLAD